MMFRVFFVFLHIYIVFLSSYELFVVVQMTKKKKQDVKRAAWDSLNLR